MGSNFPASLDTLRDPSPGDPRTDHAQEHDNENDAIVALQVKVGIDNSTDINSLDYKVNHSNISWNPQVITTELTSKFTATSAVPQIVGASGNQLKGTFVPQNDRAMMTIDICGTCFGSAYATLDLYWADNATAQFPLWTAASTSGGLTLKAGVNKSWLGDIGPDLIGTVSKTVELTGLTPNHTYNWVVACGITGGSYHIPAAGLGPSPTGAFTDIVGTPDRSKIYISGQGAINAINTPAHMGQGYAFDRPQHHNAGATITGFTAYPNGPYAVSITPDGTRLVVAGLDGKVYVVNTSTDAIIGTYTMPGTSPTGYGVACISNTTAYVVDNAHALVYPFTIATGAFGTSIAVGTSPKRARASVDGSLVFVPNTGTNTLSIIRTATNAVTTVTFAAAVRPVGVGVTSTINYTSGGMIWVAENGNNTVIPVTIPANGGTPVVGTASAAAPHPITCIAVDADNLTAWVGMVQADTNIHIGQIWVGADYPGQWYITDVAGAGIFSSNCNIQAAFIDNYGSLTFADYGNGYWEWPNASFSIDPTSGFGNLYGHVIYEDLPHS